MQYSPSTALLVRLRASERGSRSSVVGYLTKIVHLASSELMAIVILEQGIERNYESLTPLVYQERVKCDNRDSV